MYRTILNLARFKSERASPVLWAHDESKDVILIFG